MQKFEIIQLHMGLIRTINDRLKNYEPEPRLNKL